MLEDDNDPDEEREDAAAEGGGIIVWGPPGLGGLDTGMVGGGGETGDAGFCMGAGCGEAPAVVWCWVTEVGGVGEGGGIWL